MFPTYICSRPTDEILKINQLLKSINFFNQKVTEIKFYFHEENAVRNIIF